MNGQTAKLLRKTSGGDRWKYKMVKGAWPKLPWPMRHQGKMMMRDLIEVERQHKELEKMNLEPPVELPKFDKAPLMGPE